MSKDDSQQPLITSEEEIQELARGFQKSRVLLTALELDIFTLISREGKSSKEVSETIGTDERATDRLMNALVAMGLLNKKGEKFSDTPASGKWLSRESPDFRAMLLHVNHLWDSWSTMTDAVKAGTRVYEKPEGKDDAIRERHFIEAMHDRARDSADELVRLIDLQNVNRVMDVGGGSGVYSMAFVRAREGM